MPPRVVDLRSDTVTQPTDEMRAAMRDAPVGDDVFGEDPTVNALQELAARKTGKEAALFVPTGTMGNEIAVFVHSHQQGEIVAERESHLVLYESGGPAVLSRVQIRTLEGRRGVFSPRQLAEAIRTDDEHEPPTTMVGIENTHNLAGGTVWTPSQTAAVARVAHDHGVPVHLDGARLFNSAVAQGVSASALAKPADSVMFCVSKGLSAPVGSLLCGSKEFAAKARRVRKLFGGGMRQAGILAAAGIVALETMVDRLKEDHVNARRLAVGLAKLPGLALDLEAVQTNIVFADVSASGLSGKQFEERLAQRGVKTIALDARRVRLVTHRHVTQRDVEYVLAAAEEALSSARRSPSRSRNVARPSVR